MTHAVFLIRTTHPDNYGGGETYQLRLAGELERHGYRPIIVTSSRQLLRRAKKSHYETITAPYIRRQNWSGWRNLLLPLYALHQLHLHHWYRRIFRYHHPGAVIVQSRDDQLAATRAAGAQGIKVFWLDHMDFRTWTLTNAARKFKNPIGHRLLRLARQIDRLIFISDFERQYFEKLTAAQPYHNLITIKNGAADQLAAYRHVSPAPDSFCYVGRLVDYKGINELLAAFAKVHQSHPTATLHLYGDGEPSLIAKAERTLGVTYHGFASDPLAAIAAHQIFILPSYREGLSLSLLDAAMLGRTIIASRVDGNPEIVIHQKTGLLVPARNSQKLATAMSELLDRPALARTLAAAARTHYEQNFNFSRIVADQFLPLLQNQKTS